MTMDNMITQMCIISKSSFIAIESENNRLMYAWEHLGNLSIFQKIFKFLQIHILTNIQLFHWENFINSRSLSLFQYTFK